MKLAHILLKLLLLFRVNWESSRGVSSDSASTETNIFDERSKYLYTYCTIIAIVIYLVFQRVLAFIHMCLKASRRLHDKMFRGIIRATMYFFNTNPSGRIINRFSKDIGVIDLTLPFVLYESIYVGEAMSFITCINVMKTNLSFVVCYAINWNNGISFNIQLLAYHSNTSRSCNILYNTQHIRTDCEGCKTYRSFK